MNLRNQNCMALEYKQTRHQNNAQNTTHPKINPEIYNTLDIDKHAQNTSWRKVLSIN